MENILLRLQRWYVSQCDGEWEHRMGIRIGSLDNPGWAVQVDLKGTPLANKPFRPVEQGVGDAQDESTNWHSIRVEGDVFTGAGDPSKLTFILKTFLDWAEGS